MARGLGPSVEHLFCLEVVEAREGEQAKARGLWSDHGSGGLQLWGATLSVSGTHETVQSVDFGDGLSWNPGSTLPCWKCDLEQCA